MSNVAPIPARIPLFAEPAGRAGDWWEPIPVSAAEVATGLAAEANRLRLPVDLLATLLVEHALIERDIADCGVDGARARAVLVSAGEDQPTTGPGRLHTSYARMLRRGERDYERESDAQLAQRDLMLPLRLHDAARSLDLGEVCIESLDEAIAWEIAATTSGQFMREWALRLLLAEFSAQATRK
jgi:hypothetical protein